ncbi:MAG: phospholipid carrier-dependent glycosyltransferase, partial [Saprospiraceae bacterium]
MDRFPRWLEPALLTLVTLTLFWLGNDRVALWDRDEPRYVETARNMVQSGDYIVPYFNGEFRFQKPVLTYWLVALATQFGSETPFWHRFFSGLCVAGSCLLVWGLGNRMFGRPAGLFAGLMTATCPTVLLLGKLCLPDGPQLLFATACFYALYRVHEREGENDAGKRRAAFLFWVSLAAATLIKGPVVLGMIGAFLFVYWLLTRTSPAGFSLRWRLGPLLYAGLT